MPRMAHPVLVLPGSNTAIQELIKATMSAGVPQKTMDLVHLRTSQINGCSFCVSSGAQAAKKAAGADDDRHFSQLFSVAAWREAPWFDDAERAALALAEAMTRLSDGADPVPDEIWDETAKYYDERQLAALVLWIATSNLFNRVNVTVRQPAGEAPWG